MAGIYGDLLAFFPEQFISVKYYKKEPRIGAGFDTKEEGITDVIIQPQKSFLLELGKNISQASNDVLGERDKEFIWAPDDTPLDVGMFIINDREQLCAVTGRSDLANYGGFYRFDFEVVQGAQGGDRPSASVIKGKF